MNGHMIILQFVCRQNLDIPNVLSDMHRLNLYNQNYKRYNNMTLNVKTRGHV